MNLEIVKKILDEYLEDKDLFIYSLKIKKEYSINTIEILLDSIKPVTLDELSLCNSYVSEKLDQYDESWDDYYLEVSSAGAEKELRSLEEVARYVNYYVYFKTDALEIEGKLIEVDGEFLTVKQNLKGRMKNHKVNYNDITFIRLAVHF